jgi:hypothetical protein
VRRTAWILAALTTLAAHGCRSSPGPRVSTLAPGSEEFDRRLRADLADYFKEKRQARVAVAYELLRKAPPAPRGAKPHYYAWVKVSEGRKIVDEGVVRVSTLTRSAFLVTLFVPKKDLQAKPSAIAQQFPGALSDEVRARAGAR